MGALRQSAAQNKKPRPAGRPWVGGEVPKGRSVFRRQHDGEHAGGFRWESGLHHSAAALIGERGMSKWYSVSCEACGTEIHAHEDWDRPPKYCRSCKAEKARQWYDVSCQDCGTTIKAHRDWRSPPRFCPECKASRNAKWYDVSCQSCGTTIRANRDWKHEPRYCPSCKARKATEWYDKACEACGMTITAR